MDTTENQSMTPLPPADAPDGLLQRFDKAVGYCPFGDDKKRRSEALRQFTAEEAEEIKRLWFYRQARWDRDAAERKLEEEKHNRQVRLQEFLSDLGPRLAGATLENFVVTSDPKYRKLQEAVLATIRGYAANLEGNVRNGVGLWLHGTVGTGKDHFALALAKTAILAFGMGASRVYNGESGEFVIPVVTRGLRVARTSGAEIFRGAREAMHEEREGQFIRELTGPDILVLSDPLPPVGDLTPFQAETLFEVADTRNGRKRPTWTTLNVVDNAEADRRLGPAIADRLRHDAIDLECRWPSYRTEQHD